MPNIIAYAAIIIWPFMVFMFLRRYGFQAGVVISLLLGYLFLPAGFNINLPGIPAFDKFSVTSIVLFIYMVFTGRRIGINKLPNSMKLVFYIYLITPFFTTYTNQNPLLFLPGMSWYDAISFSVKNFIYFFPFLIGVVYFQTNESQKIIFKSFLIAAVVYSFFVLYEIRMSPQLHTTLYGYFPHDWMQQYRGGGFRAVVFMGHGLLVALFIALGIAFAAAMYKIKSNVLPVKNAFLIILLVITLALSKSYAAFAFGIFAYISVMYLSTRLVHKMTAFMAVIFILYPLLSSTGLFPHSQIINFANNFSEERAGSLNYRFENEIILLDKANLKPFFGWGTWGRNRVFDPETGEDISVTDGNWVITLGMSGWFGFLSKFLFIVVPILLAYRLSKRYQIVNKNDKTLLAAHAVILTIILIDQLPNSSLNPVYWFIAGSLLGRVYGIQQELKSLANSNAISKDLNVSDRSTLVQRI